MLRLIIITVVVFSVSVVYHSRMRLHDRVELATDSLVLESFEYGYTCRAAGQPHDECLAVVKKLLNN